MDGAGLTRGRLMRHNRDAAYYRPTAVYQPSPCTKVSSARRFKTLIGIKPAGVHVVKIVFRFKIGKIPFKTFAAVCEARRGGKARAGADQNGIRLLKRCVQTVKQAGGGVGGKAVHPLL